MLVYKKDILYCVNPKCQYVHEGRCIMRLFGCKKKKLPENTPSRRK